MRASLTPAILFVISTWATAATAFEPVFVDLAPVEFKIARPAENQSLTVAFKSAGQVTLLEETAVFLKEHTDIAIQVEGHCDKQECSRYDCQSLSMRRAQYVRSWLVEHGVKQEQLPPSKGFGSTVPIDRSGTESARQHNRRVSFTILAPAN